MSTAISLFIPCPGRMAWDTVRHTDVAPAMYAPLLFVTFILTIMGGMSAAFLLGYAIHLRRKKHQVPGLKPP